MVFNIVIVIQFFDITGWQKKPDGKVREEKDPITPPTFHLRYVKNERPVVLRGVLKGAPVTELWEEDNYLKEK
jgi:hypothetical protein